MSAATMLVLLLLSFANCSLFPKQANRALTAQRVSKEQSGDEEDSVKIEEFKDNREKREIIEYSMKKPEISLLVFIWTLGTAAKLRIGEFELLIR